MALCPVWGLTLLSPGPGSRHWTSGAHRQGEAVPDSQRRLSLGGWFWREFDDLPCPFNISLTRTICP